MAPLEDLRRLLPEWTVLLNCLVPGLIVGVIAPSHPIRNAILLMVACFLVIAIRISLVKLVPPLEAFTRIHTISYFVRSCIYGVLAASCGARASNSIYRLPHHFKTFFTAA